MHHMVQSVQSFSYSVKICAIMKNKTLHRINIKSVIVPNLEYLQWTCSPSLQMHMCLNIHMQHECIEAGTTLRQHALSPSSVHGLQTKTVLHGTADSWFTPSAIFSSTRYTLAPTHTHHMCIHPLSPLQLRSTTGRAEAISTSSCGLPRGVTAAFYVFLESFLALHPMIECRAAKLWMGCHWTEFRSERLKCTCLFK